MTMKISVPRRRGFAIMWIIFVETIRAYWYRSASIDFEVGEA